MIAFLIIAVALAMAVGLWVGFKYGKNFTSFSQVREFHQKFGHPAPEFPTLIAGRRATLRISLIDEELSELKQAIASNNLIGIADALGDLDYVVNGAAVEFGIDLPAITAEIHRSNMTKLGEDGKPIYREDGKILKGNSYTPPRLESILGLD